MQYTNFHYDSDKDESNTNNSSSENHKKHKKHKDNSLDEKAPKQLYSNYKQE